MMANVVGRINCTIDAWLLAPETNAAGRLGVFRIFYALFFLWYLSTVWATSLSGIPHEFAPKRILLIEWAPIDMPVTFFGVLESVLVGALVFLLAGFRTRIATAIVLVCGCLIEAFLTRTDFERSGIMLYALIPGVMLFVGDWSAKYSLDALLRQRAGTPPVDSADQSSQFVLPIHFILAVLVFLFVSSGVYKLLPEARWLAHPDNFGNIVLQRNVELARLGLAANPIAAFVATTPGFELLIRYLVVIFELAFIFVFFSRTFSFFILSWALFFHSLNAIFLLVTFSSIYVTYGLFVDWEGVARRLCLPQVAFFEKAPSALLIGTTVFVAVTVATLWNTTPMLRDFMNVGGLINARTIWYPILPLSAVLWGIATFQLMMSTTRWLGSQGIVGQKR